MDKINMAMPLSEIPFIYDREKTLNILNGNGIYTINDLVDFTGDELMGMGISGSACAYLREFLVAHYVHLREEDEAPINILHAHLTPEVWERRRYEVAKEVLIKMLGTSNHCDMQRALNEEINKSIDIATTFIKKLKVISENEMLDGDWK